MDDFGTDRSSLTYLCRLPVDRLKLDQSLIHRMTLDSKSAEVARFIVSLGYLLGRPMPAKQAQLALRKVWGNRVMPIPAPSKNAIACSHA